MKPGQKTLLAYFDEKTPKSSRFGRLPVGEKLKDLNQNSDLSLREMINLIRFNPLTTSLYLPLDWVKTDPERFQNRETEFSEVSAESVAKFFDPNLFDPIVVWEDPADGYIYVLSGHSRFKGVNLFFDNPENRTLSNGAFFYNGDQILTISARFFEGSEEDAIIYSKLEANRSATAENIVEDVKAYKLAVEGSDTVKPLPKKEIKQIFKGKVNKLESYRYLNPKGLFMTYLGVENKTEFPYIERLAQWIGDLRKAYLDRFTNRMEDEAFHFFYSDKTGKNIRIKKDAFFDLVSKRFSWDDPDALLFPECDETGCKKIQDLEKEGIFKENYAQITKLDNLSKMIRERLRSNDRGEKIYTEEERQRVLEELQKIESELEQARQGLRTFKRSNLSLFGIYSRLSGLL